MIKLLHSSFLLTFLLIVNLGYSQSKSTQLHFHNENEVTFLSNTENLMQEMGLELNKKDISYNLSHDKEQYSYLYQNQDHDHEESLTLIDIISSDEGTDFNCSGGFCMNELHYHKKGLTLKRQLFGYFMSISC